MLQVPELGSPCGIVTSPSALAVALIGIAIFALGFYAGWANRSDRKPD